MAAKQAPEVPPAQKVKTSYQQLSLAATNLNTATDELGKAISVWDAALQKLNLGISAWVELSGGDSIPNGSTWWTREIGYGKVESKWGIALRTRQGRYDDPDCDDEEMWPFNQAPRWMRIEAIPKLPDLLEALLKQTESTTKKIIDKTTQAYELAAAMSEPQNATTALDQYAPVSESGVVDSIYKAFRSPIPEAAIQVTNFPTATSGIIAGLDEAVAGMDKASKGSNRK